jgi:putative tricarboxylic transport membrane protein
MSAEILFEALSLLADPMVLALLLCGVVAGLAVGAMPGLSATLAVALLIPFTFDLSLMPALAMLVGVYCGAVYGGSVPAVLFRTPGTPASAATVLDGYALTRKGQSQRALTTAALSAMIGGLIGTALLILLAPQIAGFALMFGSPEYFALAVFGLSMVVSVSGASVLKGAAVAVFGFLLATAGMDPISGYPRFLFGSASLMEGIPFIPALIGLFALAEVFRAFTNTAEVKQGDAGGVAWPNRADAKHCLWTSTRSGLMGTAVGSTPGAGSDIAAFMAYSVARQRAKPDEKFGEGELKGVAAPEAAKSASISGSMVPLLSLGIPGDSVTAVIIGAFILHGVQPGPLLFAQNGGLAYAILGAVLVAHVLVFLTAILGTRYLVRVLACNRQFLLASIVVLSLLGAFALRGNLLDVWVAIAFGVIGFGLEKFSYPVAPLLLALILGPMAEENFRRSLILAEGNYATFLTSPICATILAFAALSLVYGTWRSRRGRAGIGVDATTSDHQNGSIT